MRSKAYTFPPPSKGWIANANLLKAPRESAEVLDNFFPTSQGARLRRGSKLHATVGAAVARILPYRSGTSEFFATTASAIYDATSPADAAVAELPAVKGFSSGDWSAQQIATSGGEFLLCVNGTDWMQRYDGTDWNPCNTAAVNKIAYDALTGEFAVGETVTGGTSGASAEILSIEPATATTGVLKIGTITSGPFQDDEALTDGATGAATANGASASSSANTITGISTKSLSHIWMFKGRIWFIEKDSLSAWYLAADSISGAATEFPLRSTFNRGGQLLFGASWSVDAGDGLDDVMVFGTTEGEIAIYQGTNPASDFVLSGVYYIGEPLDKHAHLRIGANLAVMTEDGIISVGSAIGSGDTAFLTSSLTSPIEDAWRETIANRTTSYPINATLWPSQSMLVVGTPNKLQGQSVAFVANARTGAWCRYVGWDVRCAALVDDTLYFGTNDGEVMQAETTGNDNSTPYAAMWVPKFQEDDPVYKSLRLARFRGRASLSYEIALAGYADYSWSVLTAQPSTETDSSNTWGTGVWGTMTWGGEATPVAVSEWQAVATFGTAVVPALAVQVNRAPDPDLELIALDAVIEKGKVI